jgi:hypothetical protein
MAERPLDERDCFYVSSRGILKSCDVFPNAPISSAIGVHDHDWSSLRAGDVVYVHGSAMRDFCTRILPSLRVPIVLVSGDCDLSIPFNAFADEGGFRTFIANPRIWHWFAQNLAMTHPKCSHIPIGLDYHTLAGSIDHAWGARAEPAAQEETLKRVAREAPAWRDRQPRAYCNFHFQMWTRFGIDRKAALARMARDALYLEPAPTKRLDGWVAQARYAFVASPHGGGLDCHRTWEALVLGCIPIVRKSGLEPLYAGLPVLTVDDWAEVTPDRLRAVHADPPTMKIPEKLSLSYWVAMIRRAQAACRASGA